MSIKLSLQNKPGLPAWALTDLLLIVRQFRCHVSLNDGNISVDGKKLLQVISMLRFDLSKVDVRIEGQDEEQALDYIVNSQIGRFVAQNR